MDYNNYFWLYSSYEAAIVWASLTWLSSCQKRRLYRMSYGSGMMMMKTIEMSQVERSSSCSSSTIISIYIFYVSL